MNVILEKQKKKEESFLKEGPESMAAFNT